jgi:hypothetical protein
MLLGSCLTAASGRCKGSVVAMQYSRQYVVDKFRLLGYSQLADEALRDLPDPVDLDELQAWSMRHGLSRDELISRMGGSP